MSEEENELLYSTLEEAVAILDSTLDTLDALDVLDAIGDIGN